MIICVLFMVICKRCIFVHILFHGWCFFFGILLGSRLSACLFYNCTNWFKKQLVRSTSSIRMIFKDFQSERERESESQRMSKTCYHNFSSSFFRLHVNTIRAKVQSGCFFASFVSIYIFWILVADMLFSSRLVFFFVAVVVVVVLLTVFMGIVNIVFLSLSRPLSLLRARMSTFNVSILVCLNYTLYHLKENISVRWAFWPQWYQFGASDVHRFPVYYIKIHIKFSMAFLSWLQSL